MRTYMFAYLYSVERNKLKTSIMKNLINTIELLEGKRDNGTITMNEDAKLVRLVDLAKGFLN